HAALSLILPNRAAALGLPPSASVPAFVAVGTISPHASRIVTSMAGVIGCAPSVRVGCTVNASRVAGCAWVGPSPSPQPRATVTGTSAAIMAGGKGRRAIGSLTRTLGGQVRVDASVQPVELKPEPTPPPDVRVSGWSCRVLPQGSAWSRALLGERV